MVAVLETGHFVRFILKNVITIAYWVPKHLYFKNLTSTFLDRFFLNVHVLFFTKVEGEVCKLDPVHLF